MSASLSEVIRLTPLRMRKEAGFSLIELMISIAIGLIIVAGLVGVLSANSGNSRTNDIAFELMTSGRYALNAMKQEVRQAGFLGYTGVTPTAPGALGILNGECLQAGASAGSFLSDVTQGVWGANDTNPFSGNCIPAANYAALNDILAVRRLSVFPTTTLVANTLYFQSSFEAGQLFRSTTSVPTPPTFIGNPLPLASFAVQAYVYYISPFSVSATENPLVPALYRVALQTDGSMARELVVSGIEHLQIQYGIQDGILPSAVSTRYMNTPTDWTKVNSVRIWLLARSTRPEAGYSNTTTYAMGDQTYTVADNFRRQLLTTVVQLRN